jgi:hypothetical protein
VDERRIIEFDVTESKALGFEDLGHACLFRSIVVWLLPQVLEADAPGCAA